jgi:hypothetical protein
MLLGTSAVVASAVMPAVQRPQGFLFAMDFGRPPAVAVVSVVDEFCRIIWTYTAEEYQSMIGVSG